MTRLGPGRALFCSSAGCSDDMSLSSRRDCCDPRYDPLDYCLGSCHHRSLVKDSEGKIAKAKGRHLVAINYDDITILPPDKVRPQPAQIATSCSRLVICGRDLIWEFLKAEADSFIKWLLNGPFSPTFWLWASHFLDEYPWECHFWALASESL